MPLRGFRAACISNLSYLGAIVRQLTGNDCGQYPPTMNSCPISWYTFGLLFGSGCNMVMIICLAVADMFPVILEREKHLLKLGISLLVRFFFDFVKEASY
jgi:hypothetical protein